MPKSFTELSLVWYKARRREHRVRIENANNDQLAKLIVKSYKLPSFIYYLPSPSSTGWM